MSRTITDEEAQEFIDIRKTFRPSCSKCETRPFVASLKEPDGPEGFEVMSHFAGYVKRCETCANTLLYPMADHLDPAKVKAWLQKRTDEEGGAAFSFKVEELEPLVRE
jgi:hypothetical protein